MKLRGTYIKVIDLQKALSFYTTLFGHEPIAMQPDYYEYALDNAYFGVSLNNYNDTYEPSNAVAMFHLDESEARAMAQRGQELGGKLVFNGMADQNMRCIIISDPFGNELEFNALPFEK